VALGVACLLGCNDDATSSAAANGTNIDSSSTDSATTDSATTDSSSSSTSGADNTSSNTRAGSGGSAGTFSSATGGTAAGGSGGAASDAGQTTSTTTGATSLSQRYPGDVGIAEASSVLFHDDFESGWGRWDGPDQDTSTLLLETDQAVAYGGVSYLRSTVTQADLEVDEYISSAAWVDLPERTDVFYLRFHVQFKDIAPNPHHWVRLAAGNTEFASSGLANTVPAGDAGFWFDLDADNDDVFNFYVYWYKMRSGRCNDGSTTPGCAGDQGNTYHYGNVFRPPNQQSFPRDTWFCVELRGETNSIGSSDGKLTLWLDDQLVGDYGPGYPDGTWLRDQFHTGGCDFSACTPPMPFEGFDFRSSDEVRFKTLVLDAYYERGSSESKREALESRGLTVSNEQTILYDDVVAATERIGCKVIE
jgi:hypothetical protein